MVTRLDFQEVEVMVRLGRRLFRANSLRALLLVLAPAVPLSAGAQVLYGSLTGQVTDATGAVLPGVEVVALNVGTGSSKEATTDVAGVYVINDLQPGIYRVTIALQSFKHVVHENVRVDANTVRRADAQLAPSGVTESVEIRAESPVIQTEQGALQETQTAQEINDLPLTGSAGRNYQSLMQIVPGALMAGEQNSAAGSPQRSISFNVNGVSRLQNNTKLDGASIQYPWLPTNTAYVPSAEAIEEVSIVTNAYNAEQGIAGGAAINVIIKSGTNAFRATGWGYDTNSKFRARDYFQTTAANPKDDLRQYGGNLGGPIARNKLFFFTNWEHTNHTNSSPTRFYSLATDALRRGDFSGTGVTIYDPASNADPALRTPFPGNVIPANRIDLAAQEMINRMPLPTGAGFVNNYVAQGDGVFTRDNVDAKVNYTASNRLGLFGRYSISPSNIIDPSSLGPAGGDALNGGQVGTAPGRTQVAGVGATYTLSPTMLMDANVGYTRQRLGAENVDINSNFGLDVLKIPGTNGPDRLQGGIPSFQIAGWANLGNPNTGNPFTFQDNQYVANVNLQWVKRAHALRFGWDYQNQQLNHFQPQGGTFQTTRGTFQFNGNSTRLQGGPAPADSRFNSWADFLLGLPNAAGKVDQLRNPNSIRMQTHALYAQDTWQLNRFTLNYGVRWERYPWPTRDHGGVSRFDPADGNVYTGGVGGVPLDTGASVGIGQFLPRAGMAYRLNDRTVLRAGYGHSADPKPYIDFRNAYPINFAWSHPAITFNGVTNNFIPVTTLRQGLNQALYGVPPDLNQGIIHLPPGAGTTTFPKEDQRKYIQSWNVAVQRELFSRFSGQVAYVGTRALGQQGFININASAPGTGNAGRPLAPLGIVTDINMIMPFGDATYHALQTELHGRIGTSQVGAVYTLSRATNYQDNDANPRIQWPGAKELNKGTAGYDRTHNLQTYWVWDLPFGPNRHWTPAGAVGKLLDGWQVNGIVSVMSGQPINIVQNQSPTLNAGGSAQYPDQVKSSVKILDGIGPNNPYFDASAYAQVNIPAGQPQRFGDSGRNPIRGPGFFEVDSGFFRTLTLTDRVRLQIRIEVLNLLNHPNFQNPGGDISNAGTFGFVTATTGTAERTMRFGTRLSF
jgi:hypothetical protein